MIRVHRADINMRICHEVCVCADLLSSLWFVSTCKRSVGLLVLTAFERSRNLSGLLDSFLCVPSLSLNIIKQEQLLF